MLIAPAIKWSKITALRNVAISSLLFHIIKDKSWNNMAWFKWKLFRQIYPGTERAGLEGTRCSSGLDESLQTSAAVLARATGLPCCAVLCCQELRARHTHHPAYLGTQEEKRKRRGTQTGTFAGLGYYPRTHARTSPGCHADTDLLSGANPKRRAQKPRKASRDLLSHLCFINSQLSLHIKWQCRMLVTNSANTVSVRKKVQHLCW